MWMQISAQFHGKRCDASKSRSEENTLLGKASLKTLSTNKEEDKAMCNMYTLCLKGFVYALHPYFLAFLIVYWLQICNNFEL